MTTMGFWVDGFGYQGSIGGLSAGHFALAFTAFGNRLYYESVVQGTGMSSLGTGGKGFGGGPILPFSISNDLPNTGLTALAGGELIVCALETVVTRFKVDDAFAGCGYVAVTLELFLPDAPDPIYRCSRKPRVCGWNFGTVSVLTRMQKLDAYSKRYEWPWKAIMAVR